MTLDEDSEIYCVIFLPWGIFRYNILPMGILLAYDIFQSTMGTLFQNLEHLLVYLDDLITFSSGILDEHLVEVNEVLSRLLNKTSSKFLQIFLGRSGSLILRLRNHQERYKTST